MTAASVHTAVYDPANARVQLNYSGFAAATTGLQVVRRVVSTGRRTLVRGARLIDIGDPAADTVQLFDYEFPPGVEVAYDYYQFPDTTAWLTATAAAYDVDAPWLKSVLRSYLNTTVQVVGYEPFSHDMRTSVYAPVRRNLPVGAGDVRQARTFGLTLRTTTVGERDAIDDLLAVGGVYFLQYPSGNESLPDPGYVMCTAAREDHGPGAGTRPTRYFSLSLVEVTPPAADLAAASITWTAAAELYTDWDALVADNASWDELVGKVAAPAEIVVT
ncbi:MAG TPA: hypothetical protein VMU51_34275 [Mycobacteriales bacterium]|nr:hypothetical protein [Mycobacteriales bacterium]